MRANVFWSKTVKSITFSALLVLLAASAFFLLEGSFWSLFMMVILLLAIVYCMYWAPNFISITDNSLILHKLLGRLTLPFDQIRTIDIYQSEGVNARICGSGGLFGFTGLFYNKQIGKYRSYIGSYRQAFLVTMLNGKKYLFSCENREQIVALVKPKLTKLAD